MLFECLVDREQEASVSDSVSDNDCCGGMCQFTAHPVQQLDSGVKLCTECEASHGQ